MKNILIAITVLGICSTSIAQHTQTELQTKPATDKAMLDGKAFVVTLSGNSSAESGIENPEMNPPNRKDQGVDSRPQEKPGKTASDSKAGKKLVLRFENGKLKSSGKGDLKAENCYYNSWGIESTGISFTSDCNADRKPEDKTGIQLSGTVNGDTIHGNISCTKADGSVTTYSYTGSKAGKNDLDLENEIGLK